ncbi:MAG TPA: hypothetical protein VHW44_25005 [Pseudonocardiaceae bacterium]|jgi:hypothetical protein|nr:hypothetical protein [Pseudonocardiaceae bacterium]
MRKLIVLGAVSLAGLFASVLPAAAAVPTCLIANGAGFGKTVLCAELLDVGAAHAAQGRLSVGGPALAATLTVTVQFSPDNGPAGRWQVLATASAHGVGPLQATTPPVRERRLGSLRACSDVTTRPVRQVCSAIS